MSPTPRQSSGVRIDRQEKRATLARWTEVNPILREGEWAFEMPEDEDSNEPFKAKIGDGRHTYLELPYFNGSSQPTEPCNPCEPDLPDFTLIFENGLI